LALIVLLLTAAFSTYRDALRADLEVAATHMLWIFLPYAALVLFNLGLRLLPSTDIRSATSVFMLGPLTASAPSSWSRAFSMDFRKPSPCHPPHGTLHPCPDALPRVRPELPCRPSAVPSDSPVGLKKTVDAPGICSALTVDIRLSLNGSIRPSDGSATPSSGPSSAAPAMKKLDFLIANGRGGALTPWTH